MRGDSVKNMSAYADQNHAPSLTDIRLECGCKGKKNMRKLQSKGAAAMDMTEGTAWKMILTFSFPLVFGNLFQQLYSIVDAVVVGKFVGVDALAAVGCISWVCWLINAFLRDCSNAFSISGSVRVGNHDEEGFRGIVANGIFISIGLGSAVTAVLLWQTEHIMRLLSVQPDVIHMTRRYLVIFILTIPCGLVYNITASLLRAYGNSSITFWSMTISTIVNVVLDLMFVLVFHWGVTGAAAATWIAQFVSMGIALWAAVKTPVFRLRASDLKVDWKLIKELSGLWAPMFFNSLVISMGGFFVSKHTNQIGSYFTAGIAACGKIFGLLEAIIIAIQTGVSVYVGQNLGAGRFDRIKKGLIQITGIGIGLTALMIVIVFAVQGYVIPLFLSANDPKAYEMAFTVASSNTHVLVACMLLMTPMYLHRVTIQTLGYPRYAVIAGILQFFMRTLTVAFGPALIGVYAYYIQDGMAWLASLPVVSVPCYRYLKKKLNADKHSPTSSARSTKRRVRNIRRKNIRFWKKHS